MKASKQGSSERYREVDAESADLVEQPQLPPSTIHNSHNSPFQQHDSRQAVRDRPQPAHQSGYAGLRKSIDTAKKPEALYGHSPPQAFKPRAEGQGPAPNPNNQQASYASSSFRPVQRTKSTMANNPGNMYIEERELDLDESQPTPMPGTPYLGLQKM